MKTNDNTPLTSYRIFYADGSDVTTNMSANVTLEQARQYFSGKCFDLGVYPEEKLVKCIDVQKL